MANPILSQIKYVSLNIRQLIKMLLYTPYFKFGVRYLNLFILWQINTLNMPNFRYALNTDGVKNIVNFLKTLGCLHEMLRYLVS